MQENPPHEESLSLLSLIPRHHSRFAEVSLLPSFFHTLFPSSLPTPPSTSPTPSQNTPNFRHVFTPDYLHKTDSNAQNI